MPQVRSLRWCAAALSLSAVAVGSSLARDEAVQTTQVRFKSGAVDLPALSTPQARAAALAAVARPDGPRRILVQFDGPVPTDTRAALEAAGLRLLSHLGDYAFFATIDAAPGLRAGDVAGEGSIRAIAPIEQRWKLHPDLLDGTPPSWSIVDAKDAKNPTVAALVLFHPDAVMGIDAHKLVQALGGDVVGEVVSAPMIVVELPAASIAALAADDSVKWIEPPLPFLTETALRNDSNRNITGANLVHAAPYNLNGAGINTFVFDAGTARPSHATFGGRVTVIDSSGQSFHATHVAGTVAGDGSGSTNNRYRGMAPAANVISAGLGGGGGLPSGWLYTNPVDIEQDYNLAINTHNAHISNNSIGTNVESNGFNCAWQGDYCATDVLIDNIVRGSLGSPFRIVWAGGNERQGSRCNVEGHGQYYSTAPPATAKNHLTIGALNSNNDSMTSFSSWGPTDDGRMKPDFAGPGCEQGSDNGVTSASSSSNTSYSDLCGTSMASPTVCGLAALLLQDHAAQFPGLPMPRNSTLKVLFAQTAHDVFNPGPDYMSGYGSVRIQPAVELLRSGRWEEGQITQGEVFTRTFAVTGEEPVKVTLAWDDFPGTPNAAVALVNDLDIRLVDPSGNVHYPWTLNPQNPAADAVRTGPNRRDNIEQVFVANPTPGVWTVEIDGFNIPQGPQPFSIAGAGLNAAVRFGAVFTTPHYVLPGAPRSVEVEIEPINQTIMPETATLHVRIGDGEFAAIPMSAVSEVRYRGVLPPVVCGESGSFYFTVEGEHSGLLRYPAAAPASSFPFLVGSNDARFTDSFATDRGWSVLIVPVVGFTPTGRWERAIPIPAPGAPSADFDGDGWCYVTDNREGDFDVDNCTTVLVSPIMNAAGITSTVSYARWYHNSFNSGPNMRIEISGNGGGNWATLETVGPQSTTGWNRVTHTIPPEFATEAFQIRFWVSDTNSTRIVEAAVDAVELRVYTCADVTPCPADWNGDWVVNSQDISAFTTAWIASVQSGDDEADFNNDGAVNSADISAFITAWLHAVQNGC